MAGQEISAEFNFELRNVDVLDSTMAFVDTGKRPSGLICVFLHGNPTSSYLWRNVIPHIAETARCIAPDLIGMGRSGKPENLEYRFMDHQRYLKAFLKAVVPDDNIILVLHDWGSALGLDWARHNEVRVAGLALMEFIRPIPTWEEFPETARDTFRAFRNPDLSRKMLIDDNFFVEQFLPSCVARKMTEAEMGAYREPYKMGSSREPVWRWPQEYPIGESPSDMSVIITGAHDWLLRTEMPKIFFWATPGGLIPADKAEWYAQNLRNTRSIGIGAGIHYLQEDNPHLIGEEIKNWLEGRF